MWGCPVGIPAPAETSQLVLRFPQGVGVEGDRNIGEHQFGAPAITTAMTDFMVRILTVRF